MDHSRQMKNTAVRRFVGYAILVKTDLRFRVVPIRLNES